MYFMCILTALSSSSSLLVASSVSAIRLDKASSTRSACSRISALHCDNVELIISRKRILASFSCSLRRILSGAKSFHCRGKDSLNKHQVSMKLHCLKLTKNVSFFRVNSKKWITLPKIQYGSKSKNGPESKNGSKSN